MAIINDNDLLVVQNGGNNYKYSGAQLKDDMREFGSGGTSPTPSLAQVCAVNNSAANFNGSLTVDYLNVDSDINADDIAGDHFNCNNLNVAKDVGVDGGLSVADVIGCDTLSVAGQLSWSGGRQTTHAAFLAGNGKIWSGATYNGGAPHNPRQVLASQDGVFGAAGARTAEELLAATDVDTTNYLNVLNDIELLKFDDGLVELKYTSLVNNSNAAMLRYDDSTSINSINLPSYLAAVCKQQQQLIENLTTRIEQLEADHASAMNNMEDENGSSAY